MDTPENIAYYVKVRRTECNHCRKQIKIGFYSNMDVVFRGFYLLINFSRTDNMLLWYVCLVIFVLLRFHSISGSLDFNWLNRKNHHWESRAWFILDSLILYFRFHGNTRPDWWSEKLHFTFTYEFECCLEIQCTPFL